MIVRHPAKLKNRKKNSEAKKSKEVYNAHMFIIFSSRIS